MALNTNPNAHLDLYSLISREEDAATLAWIKKNPRNQLKAELYVAEHAARLGGKRKTRDAHAVELYLDENIEILTEKLLQHEYRPSPGEAHIITKPVMREIFAAPYIDRIVQHYVVDTIYPWWDRRLNHGASSCRLWKGTSFAVELLDRHIRQASLNFARPVTVIKMDISGYFMHIDRKKLTERVLWGLERQFAGHYGRRYEVVKAAIIAIAMDNPIKNVRIRGKLEDWRELPNDKSLFMAPPGCGLVIGNVSSQVFSNIYLDSLDRYVSMELGYKYYGRYVDDFYIVVPDEEVPKVMRDVEWIDLFLRGLGLKLNRKKTRVIPSWQGVPFLGVVNKNGVLMPDKRVVRNFRVAAKSYIAGVDVEHVHASLVSYLGLLKNYNSWRVIEDAFRGNKVALGEFRRVFGEGFGPVEYFA